MKPHLAIILLCFAAALTCAAQASPQDVVAPGDNLWTVSAAHLAAMTSQPVGSLPDASVASYWQQVCAVNRSQLRSGNVNMIFPGEQIKLPPVGP